MCTCTCLKDKRSQHKLQFLTCALSIQPSQETKKDPKIDIRRFYLKEQKLSSLLYLFIFRQGAEDWRLTSDSVETHTEIAFNALSGTTSLYPPRRQDEYLYLGRSLFLETRIACKHKPQKAPLLLTPHRYSSTRYMTGKCKKEVSFSAAVICRCME